MNTYQEMIYFIAVKNLKNINIYKMLKTHVIILL